MIKFVNNYVKNTSFGYMSFELNYDYHLCVYFKDDINLFSKFYSTDKLAIEQKYLILIC